MRAVAVAFFLGILLCQQFERLPDLHWAWLLLPLLPLLRRPRWRVPAALLIGVLYMGLRGQLVLQHALPDALEKQDVSVEGVVDGFPEAQARGLRFTFQVERLTWRDRDWPSPGRVRLTWYRGFPADLRPGQRWRFTVRLKHSRGLLNPGGFDAEAKLFQQRVRAVGYVREKAPRQLLAAPPAWHGEDLRYRLWQRLQAALDGQPRAGAVSALALGAYQGMSPAEWETLRRTGTTHLMAISGLHIGLVAALVFFLGRRLWGCAGQRLLLHWPAQRLAGLTALLAAGGYAWLAGFSVPTQRALIMIAVVMFSLGWMRRSAVSHVLALALCLVLIWDPLAAQAPGFWLSFGAVAVILYALQGRLRLSGQWLRVHLVVALGLAPLLVFWFGQVPLISPVANLLAVPWVSLLIVPLGLLGALFLPVWTEAGTWLLHSAACLLDWLWWFLDGLAGWDWALWQQPAPPAWTVALAAAGGLVLLLPRGFPGRWLGGLWLLPMLYAPPPRPAPGELWFTLLDVGQGLAAVLRTREHVLVYDAGPRFGEDNDAGRSVLLPYLAGQGIRELDGLLLSHGDEDHSGGVSSLLAGLPVREVLGNAAALFPGRAVSPCEAGRAWEWDGVRFDILHPSATARAFGDNDRACVLKAGPPGATVLLTGDIERGAENHLLKTGPQRLRAEILVVPHHGSKTSSTPAFIDAVSPRYALFSTGYRNRFGFPKQAVVARYRARGALVLDTAEAGALSFVLTPQGIAGPVSARHVSPRFWRQPAP